MLTVQLGSAVRDWEERPLDEHRTSSARSFRVCRSRIFVRVCSSWRIFAMSALKVLQVIGGEEWNTFYYSWEPIKKVKTCWKWICVVQSGCPERRVNSCGVHLIACQFLCVCCSHLCHLYWPACLHCTVIWMQYMYIYIYGISSFMPLHSEALIHNLKKSSVSQRAPAGPIKVWKLPLVCCIVLKRATWASQECVYFLKHITIHFGS